jgi:hypothetical protein
MNRASRENRDHYKEKNYKDLIEYWGEIVSNEKLPHEQRLQAARDAAPYLFNKLGAKPASPDPVYFETEALPRPKSIAQACDNIALLTEMKATGRMDVATADSLINDQRYILDALVDEAKLLAANADPNVQPVIRIEGGLPPMPGCDVIMPQLHNGSHLELDAIAQPTIPAPQAPPDDENKPQ